MEAKILTGVLHSDAHTRLQAGELLLDYLRDEGNDIAQFEELDRLINGLCVWMASSNFKVSLGRDKKWKLSLGVRLHFENLWSIYYACNIWKSPLQPALPKLCRV